MNILQVKSIVYRYTGVFLAHKEENEFRDSKEYWKQYRKMIKHAKADDLTDSDIADIIIGSWQCKHKFYRPMSFLRFRNPSIFWKTLDWFYLLYIVVKQDLLNI